MTPAVSNIPSNDLLIGDISPRALAVYLALVSAAYCGLHISAWNNHFPSGAEAILWKIFSIVVFVGAIVASYVIVSQ